MGKLIFYIGLSFVVFFGAFSCRSSSDEAGSICEETKVEQLRIAPEPYSMDAQDGVCREMDGLNFGGVNEVEIVSEDDLIAPSDHFEIGDQDRVSVTLFLILIINSCVVWFLRSGL